MKKNKILHNKIVLFLASNLNYISFLCFYYNNNIDNLFEMFVKDIIFVSFLVFLLHSLLFFLLYRYTKDIQKTFYIFFFFTFFYVINYNIFVLFFLLFSFFLLLHVTKKKFSSNFDTIIGILLSISLFLFFYHCSIVIYNAKTMNTNIKTYRIKEKIKVDETLPSPNIYWIHVDGMMSNNTMKKYFEYDNKSLSDYFKENHYCTNEKASVVLGHQTNLALISFFNPNYYDNFLKDYLLELEQVYLKKKKTTSFHVNYQELLDRRVDNELFTSFQKKGYQTVVISEFNQYSSINADYKYDYYNYNIDGNHLKNKKELRLIKEKKIEKIKDYSNYRHLKSVLQNTVFHFLPDINFLNTEKISYHDIDLEKYEEINKSSYWAIKAMTKALSLTKEQKREKLVFLDYDLNHIPLSFDRNGKKLSKEKEGDLKYYLGNYIYSTKLLIELLNYVKEMDEKAIIVVEADHGLHVYDNKYLMTYFNISNQEAQDIKNSVMNAVYIPKEIKNGEEEYLSNPLNISRYLVNRFVDKDHYSYIENKHK